MLLGPLPEHLSGGERKVKGGSPVHCHIIEIIRMFFLKLNLNMPPCDPHPQSWLSPLVPQKENPSAMRVLCILRVTEPIFNSQPNMPSSFNGFCDMVLSLFPIIASFVSLRTHPRLSNKPHKIEVQGWMHNPKYTQNKGELNGIFSWLGPRLH